eukprot:1163704-Prorocentrum_minimum.AAC.2
MVAFEESDDVPQTLITVAPCDDHITEVFTVCKKLEATYGNVLGILVPATDELKKPGYTGNGATLNIYPTRLFSTDLGFCLLDFSILGNSKCEISEQSPVLTTGVTVYDTDTDMIRGVAASGVARLFVGPRDGPGVVAHAAAGAANCGLR